MVLMCSHPYSCTLQEFNLETFRLSKHWWWWMLPTRNGKRKLCKLNPYINNEIFCMCSIESEGYLWLMRTFTDAEQELCEFFMVLKGYKDLQKLWDSRLAALQCDMHLGAGMAPLYRDGMEPLSPLFHRLWYLLLGEWGGRGHLHVKDKRDKNCRSERKNQGKETRWVVDRIIPVLAKGKRVFASDQSADLPQISWNIVIWIRITGGFVFFVCFVVITSITSQTCVALEML